MYGPASSSGGGSSYGSGGGGGGRGGGRGGPRERQYTPKGQMAGSQNQKTAIEDLPDPMRMMFAPRRRIAAVPAEKRTEPPAMIGIGAFMSDFETTAPLVTNPFEHPIDRIKRIASERNSLHKEKMELLASSWDPHANPKATSDAFNTLFVGRLSYDTTEKKLRREFEQYGPIKCIRVVLNTTDQRPRGYAFVEFENEDDMKTAFKRADGKKIDGRRILLDVERGRTVRNWRPTRLGGGMGGRKAKKSKKTVAEEALLGQVASVMPLVCAAAVPKAAGSSSSSSSGAAAMSSRPREESRVGSGGGGQRDRPRDEGRGGGDSSRYGSAGASRSNRADSRDRGGGGGVDRDRDRERERDSGRRPVTSGSGGYDNTRDARRSGRSRSRSRDNYSSRR